MGGAGGGPDSVAYVGNGGGDFVQETKFTYVGWGGDFDVIRPRRDFTCPLAACCLCCLFLIPLLMWLLSAGTQSYDCETDFTQWQTVWSPRHQQFCCRMEQRGCAGAEPAPPAGPVDPFNCADGVLNWKAGWSTEKKQWCCHQHGKGCGHDAEVAAAQYDCNAA